MNTLNIVNGGILSFPKDKVSSLSSVLSGLSTADDNLKVSMGHNFDVIDVSDIEFDVQDTMHTESHYNFCVSLEFNVELDCADTVTADEATDYFDWHIEGLGGSFNVKHSEVTDLR